MAFSNVLTLAGSTLTGGITHPFLARWTQCSSVARAGGPRLFSTSASVIIIEAWNQDLRRSIRVEIRPEFARPADDYHVERRGGKLVRPSARSWVGTNGEDHARSSIDCGRDVLV